MKKLFKTFATALPLLALLIFLPIGVYAADGQNMYRLYNPNSGEHFYTANTAERDSLTRTGWSYEGIGWVAPKSGKPVYRLYNGNAGDHHYTTSAGERDSLIHAGWKSEGTGWYSGGSVALYRQYNPNAKTGTHNYTTNKGENDALVRAGWKSEGIGWYGIGGGKTIEYNRKIKAYADFSNLEANENYKTYFTSPDRIAGTKMVELGDGDPFQATVYIYNNVELVDTGLKGTAVQNIISGYGANNLRWRYSNGSQGICDQILADARNHGYRIEKEFSGTTYAHMSFYGGHLYLTFNPQTREIEIGLGAN